MAIHPDLPRNCYALLPSTGELIIIQRGELGYYRTDYDAASSTQETVDALNKRLGVTHAQARAMMAGSMFGWDNPIADPAAHEGDLH